MTETHSYEPYVSPKVIIGPSPIHGRGMMAQEAIAADELVFAKGGFLLPHNQLPDDPAESYLPVGDDLFLAGRTTDEARHVKLYVNHSCDPSCGIKSEPVAPGAENFRLFYARHPIVPGQELTVDYATIDGREFFFHCLCIAAACRGIISGQDWQDRTVQQRYQGWFAPYLAAKIASNSKGGH